PVLRRPAPWTSSGPGAEPARRCGSSPETPQPGARTPPVGRAPGTSGRGGVGELRRELKPLDGFEHALDARDLLKARAHLAVSNPALAIDEEERAIRMEPVHDQTSATDLGR